MTEFYDALETREPALREGELTAALPGLIATAQRTRAFAGILAGVEPAAVATRAALAALPVTRKHELLQRQQRERASPVGDPAGGDPFGGFSAIGWRALGTSRPARRVFQSPGTIYEPEGAAADYWRFGRALFAAGLRAGELVHNSFSYHLTPAGRMMESGAHAIGCTVFPGGVGNTDHDPERFAALYGGVVAKIFDRLPDETWVYPGHGNDTTIGQERPHLEEWRARGW
jgi:phenylacetate-CoA ligase